MENNTNVSTGTPTDSNYHSLSPLTIYEIIDKLTDKQLDHETKLIVYADNDECLATTETNKNVILKHFDTQTCVQNNHLTDKITELTKTFLRNVEKAERDMELLQDTIGTAQEMLNSLRLSPLPPPVLTPTPNGTSQLQGTDPRPLHKVEGLPLNHFNIELLDADTQYI